MKKTIIALAVLSGGIAVAQVTPRNANPSGDVPPTGKLEPQPSKLSTVDRTVVDKAASTNLSQIKLGQLAVRNGTTAQVRDLGQKMIDDHTQANDQLKPIALREGIRLPTELTPEQKADYDRLSALSGDAFNKAYMDLVKSDHKQAISLFQDEARNGVDPQLRTLAKNTLPELRQHHELAGRRVQKM